MGWLRKLLRKRRRALQIPGVVVAGGKDKVLDQGSVV